MPIQMVLLRRTIILHSHPGNALQNCLYCDMLMALHSGAGVTRPASDAVDEPPSSYNPIPLVNVRRKDLLNNRGVFRNKPSSLIDSIYLEKDQTARTI